jgi:hypothetical protein
MWNIQSRETIIPFNLYDRQNIYTSSPTQLSQVSHYIETLVYRLNSRLEATLPQRSTLTRSRPSKPSAFIRKSLFAILREIKLSISVILRIRVLRIRVLLINTNPAILAISSVGVLLAIGSVLVLFVASGVLILTFSCVGVIVASIRVIVLAHLTFVPLVCVLAILSLALSRNLHTAPPVRFGILGR